MKVVRVILGLVWGLVLSALALVYFGSSTTLSASDVIANAFKALAGCAVYALAAWLGLWFTSPRIHEHREGARIAVFVGAIPGLLVGFLLTLFLGSVMKGPA